MEKERIRNHDSVGIMGKVSATVNIIQNKNFLLSGDFNPHLQYRNKKHLVLAVAQTEYAALDAKMISNGGFFHLRYNYELHQDIQAECFTQVQYNTVWNIPFRFLLGGGPRFKLIEVKNNRLYLGPLYMYEIQVVEAGKYTQHNHRMSCYTSWNMELNSILFFSGTVYYQPLLRDFSNYRLTGLCELSFAISRHFSIDNRIAMIFDQTNTPDVPAHTYHYTAGFGYKF